MVFNWLKQTLHLVNTDSGNPISKSCTNNSNLTENAMQVGAVEHIAIFNQPGNNGVPEQYSVKFVNTNHNAEKRK
jgi:hypothetical protein